MGAFLSFFSQRTKKNTCQSCICGVLCWHVKNAGYWTRRAVLIIASEAEEYADPHTQRHTQKKKTSAASRGFVVSSCWLLSQMRDTTNCPVAFFLHFARSIAFFCTLPVPSLFFYTLPVTSLFFCNVSVTLHVFLHFARSIAFFLHFAGHIVFFLHFVCHIAFFFAIWWLLRFFFAIPCPNCIFFATGRLAIPALHFFCKTYLHH